jgi:hypothetical protein
MHKATLESYFSEWPVAKSEQIITCAILEGQPLSLSAEPNGSFIATISSEDIVNVFVTQEIQPLHGGRFRIGILYENSITEFTINEKKVLSAKEANGRTCYVESLPEPQQMVDYASNEFFIYKGPFDTHQDHNLNILARELIILLNRSKSDIIASLLVDMLLLTPSIIEEASVLHNLPITFIIIPLEEGGLHNKSNLTIHKIHTDNTLTEGRKIVDTDGLLNTFVIRLSDTFITLRSVIEGVFFVFDCRRKGQNLDELLASQLSHETKIIIKTFFNDSLIVNGENVLLRLLYSAGRIVLHGIRPLIESVNSKYGAKLPVTQVYPPGSVIYPPAKCTVCGYQYPSTYSFAIIGEEDTSGVISSIAIEATCIICGSDFRTEMRGFSMEAGVATLLSGPGITPTILSRLQSLAEDIIANPVAISTFKQEANKISPNLGDRFEEYLAGRPYTINFVSMLSAVAAAIVAGIALTNQSASNPSSTINYNITIQSPQVPIIQLPSEEELLSKQFNAMALPPLLDRQMSDNQEGNQNLILGNLGKKTSK